MLIILDGVDGAGKTTLAHDLASELTGDVRILHRGPPKRHPLLEYVKPLERYRPGSGTHVICDRWHLGELVWPYVFERETQYTDAVHRYVEMFLASRGALVVACLASPDVALARIKARGDRSLPKEKMLRASANMFVDAFNRSTVHQIRYAIDVPVQVGRILAYAKMREDFARQLLRATSEVVSDSVTNADVLLVGDRRGPALLQPRHRLPFPPYRGTSGEWLLNALPPSVNSADALRVALTNATVRERTATHLEELYLLLKPKYVVALGNEAAKVLDARGVTTYGVTVHPQYAKRFHHKRPSKYAVALRHAALEGEDTRGWFSAR